jgi:hypothetical protein
MARDGALGENEKSDVIDCRREIKEPAGAFVGSARIIFVVGSGVSHLACEMVPESVASARGMQHQESSLVKASAPHEFTC